MPKENFDKKWTAKDVKKLVKKPVVESTPEPENEKMISGDKKIVIITRSNGVVENDWELMHIRDGFATVEKEDPRSGKRLQKVIPENELQTLNPENQTEKGLLEPLNIVPNQKIIERWKKQHEEALKSSEIPELNSEPVALTDAEFNQVLEKDAEKWNPNLKLDLEALLPPSFNYLDENQKQKVLQDSKRRIVDIVKSDAQTQYSEDLKERMQEAVEGDENSRKGKVATTWRKMKSSIKSSFTKERDVKNKENEVYLKLINSAEGKKLIAEDLKMLVNNVSKQDIYMMTSTMGALKYKEIPAVLYMSGKNEYTEEEYEDVINFNSYANMFTQMPYEWGQEQSKKLWGNRKKYDDAKALYDKAKARVLEIEERINGAEKAMLTVMEVDNRVQMEQLLNTHPEFEKALNDFSKSAGNWEKIKTGISTLNTATGKNAINRALVGGGALIRTGAKVLPWLAGASTGVATLSTAIAAPVAGGVIGYWRGKFKAKETLGERQKEARYGQKDENAEKVVTTDATHLADRISKLNLEILSMPEGKKRNEKLALLSTRIDHTRGKIEKGQVNFGDKKVSLFNQFDLIDTLNRGLIIKEMNSAENTREVKERIDGLLEKVGTNIAEKTSKTQNSFIRKQALKGAALGAGLASAGYAIRWFTENVGWSGGKVSSTSKPIEVKTPNNIPNKSDSFVSREKWIKDPFGESAPKNMDAPTGAGKTFIPNEIHQAEEQAKIEANVFNKKLSVDSNTTTPTPTQTPSPTATPTPSPAETTEPASTPSPTPTPPKTPEIADESVVKNTEKTPVKIEKNIDNTIVHKGQGIEHAFIKQIESDPKLAQDLGFKGDVNDAKALHKFAQNEAHRIALENKKANLKISEADKASYKITGVDNKGKAIIEEGEGNKKYEYVEKKNIKTPEQHKIKTTHTPKHVENIKIPKGANTIDIPDSKPADKIFLRPGDKLSDTQKDIDAGTVIKEQAPAAAMDAPVTDGKPTPTPKSSPTPEEISKEIKTQIELTEKYPQFKGTTFGKNTLNIPEEKLVETYKVYEENIKHITKGETIENFKIKVGGEPASKFIEAKGEDGDLITPYINKIAKLAKETPDYDPINKDENVHHFIERCILKLTKEGKLDEIKDLKFK